MGRTASPPRSSVPPYSAALTASGGQTPYRWTLGSGTLPPGLIAPAPRATLIGVALSNGELAVLLPQVSDSANQHATQSYSLPVTGQC